MSVTRQTLLARRYWARVHEQRTRTLKRGVATYWDTRTPSVSGDFLDYNTRVPGTLPEKMIYQVLQSKGVTFFFAFYFGDIPFTTDKEESYRPDFLLPDYNIIIEVQGVYWHGREGKYESDYQRALLLEAAGYHVYTITDTEILRNPYEAIAAIPELANPPKNPGKPIVGYRPQDPTASLAAQRRKWPKVWTSRFTGTTRTTKKGVQKGFAGAAGHARDYQATGRGTVYDWRDMDADLAEQYHSFGQDWLKYMDELKAFFDQYGSAAKIAYPDLWEYYNRWKNWWSRFGRT